MKPKIFIGSSVEGISQAGALQTGLNHTAYCTVWNQAFPIGSTTIDTLLKECDKNDFAVFVFSPDDIATIRGNKWDIARDNVLYEAGLFMGRNGKDRCFIVIPQNHPTFHMPTDLAGITVATYDEHQAKTNVTAALGAAVHEIKQAIQNSSWTRIKLDISTKSIENPSATYPLKLLISITNKQHSAVLIESGEFAFDPGAAPAPNARLTRSMTYEVLFFLGRDPSTGKDIYKSKHLLEPGESIQAWVPIDPSLGQAALQSLLKSYKTGFWSYRCVWLSDFTSTTYYEEKL